MLLNEGVGRHPHADHLGLSRYDLKHDRLGTGNIIVPTENLTQRRNVMALSRAENGCLVQEEPPRSTSANLFRASSAKAA